MLKIGLSSCILGVECRFDGGHKKDDFVVDNLSGFATYHHYCPEDDAFGHPRESMRLVKKDGAIVVLGNSSKSDFTEILTEKSENICKSIESKDLDGFILKSKSPSCGIDRVKLYLPNGMPGGNGEGVFAKLLKERFPLLPLEDEGRLQDSWLKENFLMEMYAYKDIKELKANATKISELVKFHTTYKFLLLSKHQSNYRELGRIVSNSSGVSFDEVLQSYFELFCETIKKKSTKGKVLNVLEHIFGFLKNELKEGEKREILKSFDEFYKGVVPLIAPLKLLEIYILKYNIEYLKNQKFLHPYPDSLGLRSEIKAYKD
ncbi:MAG: YbgA family protein [Campylobacterales bacterium]